MERYNLASGFHVTPTVQDSGRTERDHLTGLAARDAAMLSAEGIAPSLTESTEISPFSKFPEGVTHQTEEACELVKSSGVRGEIEVRDFLVTTSTETLPVLSPDTVSTILDESLETGNEYGQPPVLHPFDVTPPVEAAYATQDVSAITPDQSILFLSQHPHFSFHPNHAPQQQQPKTRTFH